MPSPSIVPGSPTSDSPVAFDALGLHPDLLKGIQELGFTQPTPIQVQAIAPILAGRDLIGLAQTGSGKTAAFMLPILQRLLAGQGRGRVRALVLAPTRELALQSTQHLKALSRYVPLIGVAVFGGVPIDPQTAALARGIDIISATPGRLLDHVFQGHIDFGDLQVLVLDEVDRMLDMGFLPDIQRILRLLPPRRQNLVFSATLPDSIAPLVHEILRNPVAIQIGARSAPATGIRHAVYPVARHRKTDLLETLLRQEGMTSVLIFTRTKIFADRLSRTLQQRGFRVSVLHGDRSQSQRLHALEQFRRGRNQVMVATDIAARGIDIEAVSHVINWDLPQDPESYVHRIGRTARADATGDAFTLVDPSEEPLIQAIEQLLKHPLPRVSLPNFEPAARPRPSPHGAPRPAHPSGPPGGGGRRRRRRRGQRHGAPGLHPPHRPHHAPHGGSPGRLGVE